MKEKICRKLNCSDEEAEEICRDLDCIDPQFRKLLDCWCNDVEYTDVDIHGFTIESLMNDYDLGFTGALLTMDWIYKEPDNAIKALKYGIR